MFIFYLYKSFFYFLVIQDEQAFTIIESKRKILSKKARAIQQTIINNILKAN